VRFDETLTRAIDESRVTQVAATPVSGSDTVVVMATDQPFEDEIRQGRSVGATLGAMDCG
jgi:hypothetical protein